MRLPFVRHYKTRFAMAYIISLGKVLNSELVRREVRVGKYYVDFGNDIRRGIEVDGEAYHNDIVKQQERDEYFAKYGWRVLHIKATDLWRQPARVQQDVLRFLGQ